MTLPPLIKKHRWATFGRRESAEEFAGKWQQLRDRTKYLAATPKVSFIVPVFSEVSKEQFLDLVESILLQSYDKTEALFLFNETTEHLKGNLPSQFLSVVGKESEAALKNKAIRLSIGEWISFVEPDAVVSPVALSLCLKTIPEKPNSKIVFSNEKNGDEFFSKMDLSWFSLLNANVVGGLCLIQRELFVRLGFYDETLSKSYERDFLLRALEAGTEALHVPAYLYYRQERKTESGIELSQVVGRALARQQVSAEVENDGVNLAIRPLLNRVPLISVIICFRDKPECTIRCLNELAAHSSDVALEVFLVNNGSTEETLSQIEEATRGLSLRTIRLDFEGPFNFAAMHNWVVKSHATGELLFILNNDVFLQKGQLKDLAAWALAPWVGTVGMCLRFPHGAIQHAGIRAAFGGSARLARLAHVDQKDGVWNQSRSVFANTFAACVVKKSLYEEVGGLDAIDWANGFGDIAFNFECLKKNLENLYIAHVEGVHLESASRGTNYEYWEEFWLERRYPEILQKMLRQDLGFNRVPGQENTFGALLSQTRETLLAQLRERAPWLKPFKLALKKKLLKLKAWENNAGNELLRRPTES